MASQFQPQPGEIVSCTKDFRLLEKGHRYILEKRDSALVLYLRDIDKPESGDDRYTTFMATWHIEQAMREGCLVIESPVECEYDTTTFQSPKVEILIDPEIARKQAQIVAIRAASPMRPIDGRTADVDGLALFDAVRSPCLI